MSKHHNPKHRKPAGGNDAWTALLAILAICSARADSLALDVICAVAAAGVMAIIWLNRR